MRENSNIGLVKIGAVDEKRFQNYLTSQHPDVTWRQNTNNNDTWVWVLVLT